MKNISQFINESNDTVWIAIEVYTEPDHYHPKGTKSQRVVTMDTYDELRSTMRTRSHMRISSIHELSHPTRNKQDALSYLEASQKTPRKSKIDKCGADYIVWAIVMGKFQANGNTKFGWNVWDECANMPKDEPACIYVLGSTWTDSWNQEHYHASTFLYGSKDSLKEGDTVCCVDNDSQKSIRGMGKTVLSVIPVTCKDDFVKAYRERFPRNCSRPKRAFGRISDGLPWSDFGNIASIKGVGK